MYCISNVISLLQSARQLGSFLQFLETRYSSFTCNISVNHITVTYVWQTTSNFSVRSSVLQPDSTLSNTTCAQMVNWESATNFSKQPGPIDDTFFVLHASQIWNGLAAESLFLFFWLSDPQSSCDLTGKWGNAIHWEYIACMPKPVLSLNSVILEMDSGLLMARYSMRFSRQFSDMSKPLTY